MKTKHRSAACRLRSRRARRRPSTPVAATVHAGLALVAGLLFATSPAAALDLNGFQPERDHGSAALSYTSESYDQFWVGDQRVTNENLGEISTDSASLWLTWGLSDRFALIANVVGHVDAEADGLMPRSESDIQDLTVLGSFRALEVETGGLRHKLLLAAGVRLPMSSYVADAPVSIGDGSTDGLLRAVYQLERGPFFVSQQVGYDLRGDDVPDSFPLLTEIGYTVERVTFSGFYRLLIADGGTDIGDPGFTFPSLGDEYERVGAKVYARLSPQWGLSVMGFTTLDGRNTGDTTGFSGGLVVSF